MSRSAALPSRDIRAPRRVGIQQPARVTLRVVEGRRRRAPRISYLGVALEWSLLTMLGAAVLALATG